MLLELTPGCQIVYQGVIGRLEENSGHDGALVRLDGVEGLVEVQRSALIALAAPGKALGNTPLTKIEDAVWDKRSEEHTSDLQSLMRISYAVFCLKKKQQE